MSTSTTDGSTFLRTASLLAAPIAALVARLVWTPLDDSDTPGYLAAVARHPERTDNGAVLMILSALLLIPAAIALGSVLRGHAPRSARVATAMIVTGAVGMACMSTVGLFASSIARNLEPAAAIELWDAFFGDATGELIFLGIVIGAAGFIVLATGLYRSRRVPRAAAVLSGPGGAATLVTTGGPVRPLLLASAAIALVGFGWVAQSTAAPAASRVRVASPATT